MSSTKILVSACLLGESVRYDGRDNRIHNPIINELQQAKRLISVCPEVAGGLSTPRPFARIESRFPLQIIASDQTDVTDEFLLGAELAVELAQKHGCVAALMKAGSPSCGNNSVMGGSFSGKSVAGAGVTAQELIQKGIPVFNETQLPELEAFLDQIEVDLAITA